MGLSFPVTNLQFSNCPQDALSLLSSVYSTSPFPTPPPNPSLLAPPRPCLHQPLRTWQNAGEPFSHTRHSELGNSLTLKCSRVVYQGFFGISHKQKTACAHWSSETAEITWSNTHLPCTAPVPAQTRTHTEGWVRKGLRWPTSEQRQA